MLQDQKNKIMFIIFSALGFIALGGYFLPLVSIDIDALQMFSFSMDINLLTFFSFFNRSNAGASDNQMPNTSRFESLDMGDALSNLTSSLVASIVFYVVIFLFLVIILIFVFTKKFPKATNIMLGISILAYLYIGFTVSNLPNELVNTFEESFGFFGSIFTMSDMVNISLGAGYWITIIAISCMMLSKGIQYISSNKITTNTAHHAN